MRPCPVMIFVSTGPWRNALKTLSSCVGTSSKNSWGRLSDNPVDIGMKTLHNNGGRKHSFIVLTKNGLRYEYDTPILRYMTSDLAVYTSFPSYSKGLIAERIYVYMYKMDVLLLPSREHLIGNVHSISRPGQQLQGKTHEPWPLTNGNAMNNTPLFIQLNLCVDWGMLQS
jgi:hypothetical protein